MKRSFAFCSLMLVVVTLGGCPKPANYLEGSISLSHDLTFDHAQLRYFTDQRTFELGYLKDLEAGGVDVVAKIVFNEPEGGVQVGEAIDLADPAIAGIVERITAADDPFPAMDTGTVTFNEGGAETDARAVGEFSSTFTNGKTLNGTFDVTLEAASF